MRQVDVFDGATLFIKKFLFFHLIIVQSDNSWRICLANHSRSSSRFQPHQSLQWQWQSKGRDGKFLLFKHTCTLLVGLFVKWGLSCKCSSAAWVDYLNNLSGIIPLSLTTVWGGTVSQGLALLFHSKKVPGLTPTWGSAFLCIECRDQISLYAV